jgi:hypothetical protein
MKNWKNSIRKGAIWAVFLAGITVLFWGFRLLRSEEKSGAYDLRMYDYRDTRRLVDLTARAAELIRQRGPAAFEVFRQKPGKWSVGGASYLYVYNLEGLNLYHGGYPELVGKNLRDFTDLLGKKSWRLITDQLKDHREINPHGWVHYLWVPPGALDAAWKSSCNFLTALPDGRRVFVGSGIENPPPEKEFYRIIVEEAARLLEREGSSALDRLRDPRGPFTIFDHGVFVLDDQGKALIDPGFNLELPRNLFDYRDLSGSRPMMELNERLNSADSAWVVVLNQEKGEARPVKKGIYGRKAKMDDTEVTVAAICPLPRPAWMR